MPPCCGRGMACLPQRLEAVMNDARPRKAAIIAVALTIGMHHWSNICPAESDLLQGGLRVALVPSAPRATLMAWSSITARYYTMNLSQND